MAIVLLISSCGGGAAPGAVPNEKGTLTADIALPDNLLHGQTADWQVTISGGVEPYTVVWELGGGAQGTATDGTSGSFTMTGNAWQTLQYEYHVKITDSAGNSTNLTGTYEVLPKAGAPHALSIAAPAALRGAADAVWRAQWRGDSPACRVGWRMNGGALDVSEGSTASGICQDEHCFTMVNYATVSQTRTAEVKVIDADGYFVVGRLEYTVDPAEPEPALGPEQPAPPGGDQPPGDEPGPGNAAPEVVTMNFAAETWDLVVTVDDEEEGCAGLLVTLEVPWAFSIDGSPSVYSDSAGRVVYHLIPRDVFSDTTGKVEVTVTDGDGGSGRAELVPLIPALVLKPETLYAIPLTRNVRVGDTVRILVATGPLHDHLAFLNGVSVQTQTGATYIPNSLNIGEPGGSATDADGFWRALNPDGFIQPKEELTTGEELADGQTFWSFNVTPLKPLAYSFARGALFNFEMKFTAPGEYRLELLGFERVERTFYSDLLCFNHFWEDISNDHEGFWNTVVVTE